MKQFAVIGNPITHSKSPEIHAAFAEQFGIQLTYKRLLAEVGEFTPAAAQFFNHGMGANVTVPFKEDALHFADEVSVNAKLAGAVNTLSQQNGMIKGDNTDGIGLVRDIRDNHAVSVADKTVLIIGAGGASRGVILPIAEENPASITIVNRTVEKAVVLSEQFVAYANMKVQTFDELTSSYDIVINATSASLTGQSLNLADSVFATSTFAYDMMYASQPTAFMQLATGAKATAVDGLGMLVEQAAKSFEIWHGVTPDTKPVIKMMRASLS